MNEVKLPGTFEQRKAPQKHRWGMERMVKEVVDNAVHEHRNDEGDDDLERDAEHHERDRADDEANDHHRHGEQQLVGEPSSAFTTLLMVGHVDHVQSPRPLFVEAQMDDVPHDADAQEVRRRQKQRL